MNRIRPRFAAVIPLLLVATSCSRGDEKRVVAPNLPVDPPHVVSGRWIWEPAALAGAVREARANPLVQRALTTSNVAGLRPRSDLAVRAVGEDSRGVAVGLTILPFSVGNDSTHAAFISVAEASGLQAAEFAEMIVGRDPYPSEVGFEATTWGNQIAWIRTGEAYALAPHIGHLAPARIQWGKLFGCLAERMPAGCSMGAEMGREIAPNFPQAAAIGCAIGAAGGALTCGLQFLTGK